MLVSTFHTWYLSFFLHRHNFLDKFFSTQKRVNRDKKFSTKQRKSPKSWFYNSLMRQNTINCTHNFSKLQIFFRFLMWRAFSTWQSVTWRIFPHDNLSCGEFFHMTTCYVEKFLHIADFFSTGTARGARDKYQVCQTYNLESWSIWIDFMRYVLIVGDKFIPINQSDQSWYNGW